jgi:heptosyltransferase-2
MAFGSLLILCDRMKLTTDMDKILIRGVNWIGDAVMTLPTIETIKKGSNNASVSVLTRPSLSAIYDGSPFVDRVMNYNRGNKILTAMKMAWELRKEGFSKAYLLQNAFDAAFISFMAGVPERIGYERDGRGWLLTSKIPYSGEDRIIHHIEYFLNIAAFEGMKIVNRNPWIYLSLEERIKARQRLAPLKRPILGISPGAAFGETKRWLPERFIQVAQWFVLKTGGAVVLFGNDLHDRGLYETDKKLYLPLPNKLSVVGQTTLRELIALISECDLFLTNDSGPMHLARAVLTPTVSLFASTDPKLTGYREAGFKTIRSNVACSPCFKRHCPKGDLRCISSITAEEVFFELSDLIPKRKAVFFDRDGTLCHDANYLRRWEDFRPFKELPEILRLKGAGYMLIGVTNQSGIARAIVDEDFVKEVNRYFIDRHSFDDFLYCPHHPEDHCPCRKPSPGMLLTARAKYGIDLKQSFVVGDKESDILCAEAVGAQGILLGKEGSGKDRASNLKEAVDLILS